MKRNPYSSFKTLIQICLCTSFALAAQITNATPIELPDGEVGAPYSANITLELPSNTTIIYSASGLPDGLSINASEGQISGTPTTIGDYTPTITISYDGESNNLPATLKINAATGTPEITSASTASGTVDQAFSFTLTANNSPTSYTVTGLPAGLTQSTQGGPVISGTPEVAGTFEVTAFATNNLGQEGAQSILTITIDPAGAVPVITSATSLSGDADALLTYQIVATNDPTLYSASALPLGVELNTTSGLISGTPSIEATYEILLTASNSFGDSDEITLVITIGDVPQISNVLNFELTIDQVMDPLELTASNNPTSFTVNRDQLPTGLNYSDGTISGTPIEIGTFSVEIFASNAIDDGPTETLVITISEVAVVILDEKLTEPSYLVDQSNGLGLEFSFTRSKPVASDLTFTIETSNNLKDWTSYSLNAVALNTRTIDNQNGSETVTVDYPQDSTNETPRYIRYKVVRANP